MTRKQKRLLRKLILLVVLLALVLGIVKLVKSHRAAQEAEEEAARDAAGIITEQQDYSAIQYWNGNATLSFALNEEGTWVWADDPDFPLDNATVLQISELLTGLKPQQTITDGDTLDAYGLDEPTATLTATGADGEVLTLSFGNTTTDGTSYYMLMNGEESPVYIVDGTLRSAMSTAIYDMCILPELPALTADILSKVKLAAGENTLLLTAKQEEDATTWRSIVENVTGSQKVADIVADLKSLAITKCVDYRPSDEAVDICGFNAPTATVDVTYLSDGGADQFLDLTIGTLNLAGDGYYVRVGDDTTIYEMAADSVDALINGAANGLTEAVAE